MSPTRALARPLLSAIFVSSGINALRHPEYLVPATRDAGMSNPERMVQVHGVTNLAGGLALATGRFPRLAALGLAAGLLPTTYVGHAFWKAEGTDRTMQQINFLKNLGLVGGLLATAADTGGRESVPHAVGRISRRTAERADKASSKAAERADKLQQRAGKKAGSLQKQAGKRTGSLQKQAGKKVSSLT